MIHRPWPYLPRLIELMQDSSLQERSLIRPSSRAPRSSGVHASDLLKILHPQPKGRETEEDQLRIYGLLGLAFEDRAELALQVLSERKDWPWVCERSDEVAEDGVACSPDILLAPKNPKTHQLQELSLKVTWKSCAHTPMHEEGENDFPKNHQYYLDQCLTYARPLGTDSAVLLVYYVCGIWRPPQPQIHAWDLEFSQQEIAENWQALMTIKSGL